MHKRTLELAPDKTEITSEEFGAACAEFFAPTSVLPRHTEYYEAASPLQPIRQALNGAEWDAEEVDLVLTAGGSSKLPEVGRLLSGFFRCPIYAVTDPEEYESQTEISRGAAVHALRLSLTDTAVVQPRATEDLHLRTEGSTERLPLLLRGEALPCVGSPITHLRVGEDRELRLELLRGDRALFTEFFVLPEHVQPADRMTVLYDVDAGRLLSLHVSFPSCKPECSDEHRISLQLQSSWSYVHDDKSPGARAIEIEQVLKSGTANEVEEVDLRFDLISHYRELKFRERAIEQATRLSTMASRPDIRGRAVNLLGILAHEAGDLQAAVHYYRQAADIGYIHALANLALAQQARGNLEDALSAIDEALDLREYPEFHMRRAHVLERMGRGDEADQTRRTVLDELGPLNAAADRALEAAAQAAREVGDLRLEGRLQDELTARGQRRSGTRGSLPVIAE